jgi:predicted RNA-binding Zn ribbon-like protein
VEFAALDFLNSNWRDYRVSGHRADRLDEPGWLDEFLRTWSLEPSAPQPAGEIERLKALRALLWRIAERLEQGAGPSPRELKALNEALAPAALRRAVLRDGGGYRIGLEPERRDWDWVRAEIAASFAELLTKYDASRVKLCANEDCRWIFYDESKSRSRRWCADTCGNLVKVRKFRERSRAERTA